MNLLVKRLFHNVSEWITRVRGVLAPASAWAWISTALAFIFFLLAFRSEINGWNRAFDILSALMCIGIAAAHATCDVVVTKLAAPALPLPPVAQDLDASEVEDWKLILAGPLGQKVLDKIRSAHYVQVSNTTGTRDVAAAAWRAQGFADCYTYLISLGQIQVPPAPKPQSEEEDAIERMRP